MSLVTKMGNSFGYESSHDVRERARQVIGGGVLLRCVVRFLMYSHSLNIPWSCDLLHTLSFFYIYDDDVCFSLFISHVLFLFFLYTHVS